jgi:hypothetical protein
MDLFDDYENLPTEVTAILDNFASEPCSYTNCENLITELNKIGYSCEYDLSGELFNLIKI